jgi:hypothetical protein
MKAMGPLARGMEITPADTDLDHEVSSLLVTAAGTLAIRTAGGDDLSFPVLAGQQIDVRVSQVQAATTATVFGFGEWSGS